MHLPPLALLPPALLTRSACERTDNAVATDPAPRDRSSGIQLDYIDASVSPSEDFFRYANGNWLKSTEIPADKARYGAFDMLADQAREDVERIVTEALETEDAVDGSE